MVAPPASRLERGAVIADEVRVLRKEKGLSQAQLAARVGVGEMTIWRIEHGEDIRLSMAVRVVSALGAYLEIGVTGVAVGRRASPRPGGPSPTAPPVSAER